MSVTELFRERIVRWIVPRPCLACDRSIARGRPLLGLCLACRGRLKRIDGDRCDGCGRPLHGYRIPAGFRCGACRERPPAFERLIAGFVFAPPMDSVVHALKFERIEALGDALGEELAKRMRLEAELPELVTWVPLHWRRLISRGYNQAERIARPLARELGLPSRRLLTRIRSTPAQTTLPRSHRAANLAGAFAVRRPDQLRKRHVLVVDDVTTTGSTLRAAATSIRAAGAARITVLAAARTPGPEEPRARKTVIW